MKKTNLVVVVVLLVVIGGLIYLWSANQTTAPEETPLPSGEQTEEPSESHPLITINNPESNQVVSSPMTISGQARGYWYFEATFPFELQDANGQKIAEGYATAEGDWMTADYVPFTAQLSFPAPTTPTGRLIVKRSNPSGLPENDDQIIIPVRFE